MRTRPSATGVSLAAGVRRVPLLAAVLAVALGSHPAGAQQAPPQAELQSEQSLPLTFNQGLARLPGGWILSGTNSPLPATDVLARTDDAFHVVAVNQPAIPPQWRAQGYDHIGDIDVVGNVIYAPFEQPDYSLGHQATARYDATTLAFRDAVVLPQHQNSFVAVDPSSMVAFTMDEFDGDALLRYDVNAGWKPLTPLHLSMTLHHTQGASVRGGFVWISTSDPNNDLFRVDETTGAVDTIGRLGHPGGEGEGIDATPLPSGALHAMVIDPNQVTVWVEHFSLTQPAGGVAGQPAAASPAGRAASGTAGGGSLAATGGLGLLPPIGAAASGSFVVAAWWRRRTGDRRQG